MGPRSRGRLRAQLIAGVRLTQNDRLVAVQTKDGQDSITPGDALAVQVGAAPKTTFRLGNPAFGSHLWEYGRALQILGSIPGAVVDVSGPTGHLGRAVADEGIARMRLQSGLPAGGTQVIAEQHAPPGFAFAANPPSRTAGIVSSLPVPAGTRLPSLTNPQTPSPAGGDPFLFIGNVFSGATVTVTSTKTGRPDAQPFDQDQLWFVLGVPIDVQGEKFEVTQSLAGSDRLASAPLLIQAGPAPTLADPILLPPCPGSEWISVTGLSSGANLTVQINQEEYDAGQVADDATTAAPLIPPVPADATITVTQSRGGLSASASCAASNLVAIGDPDLGDDPFQCAYTVRVVSATPGALVEIRAKEREDASAAVRTISRTVVASAPVMHLRVVALSAMDEVWVAQLTCEGPWFEGPHHSVTVAPALGPPELVFPPVIGERSVRVAAVPGAAVEVFQWFEGSPRGALGAGTVDADQDRVSIYRQIVHGDQVVPRQHFCLSFSPLGPASRPAVPGSRVFALPMGQYLTFPSQTGHSLSCSADGVPAITMTCYIDGTWSCTANCINTQPGAAICDFVLSFAARDAQGVVFSTQLEGSIGGPNSGVSDEAGVPLPSSRHITWPWKASQPPRQPEFGDIATWDRILAANGVFDLLAAWGPGEITPELFEDEVPTSRAAGLPGKGIAKGSIQAYS